MKRIMVAADGSPGADRAVDVAARLAKQLGAALWIVNVNDGLADAELELGSRIEKVGVDDMLEARSRQILNHARDRAQKAGVASIHLILRTGDPAEAIIEAVASEHADAVVMGRRGRGRLSGILLGSVSQKVLSLAPCVVVAVP